MRQQIVILAVTMGLQALVGQMNSLLTIVFTTALTRLIGHIAAAIATRNSTSLRDIREQMTLISSYLLGALLAGVLTVNKLSAAVILPLLGVGVALGAHQLEAGFRQGGDFCGGVDFSGSGGFPGATLRQ